MARSRFSPRDRQHRNQQKRSWAKLQNRRSLFSGETLDGELEYRDVLVMPHGERLDYAAMAWRHAIEAMTRHHPKQQLGKRRRRAEWLARMEARFVVSEERTVIVNGNIKVKVTLTLCRACGSYAVPATTALVHSAWCPCDPGGLD